MTGNWDASLTVTAPVLRCYAGLTRDANPIHLDESFARGTIMGGIIAHGTLSAALLWQALRADGRAGAGPEDFAGASLTIRFRQPVRIGDTVRGEAVPDPDAPGRFAVRVVRQNGETVIDGALTLSTDMTGPSR